MIYVTGDTHGYFDNRYGFFKTLTDKDILIVLGDFGFSWDKSSEDTWNRQKWPFTTISVEGNHENYYRLRSYPQVQKFGNKVYKFNDNTFYLQRGRVYKIKGKTFMCIGGAASIDKGMRTPYVSWWPEELLTYKEIKRCLNTIDKVKRVDYLITHTCSRKFSDKVFNYSSKFYDPVEKFLDEVDRKLDYGMWLFGHHHKFANENNIFGLYEQVLCLDTGELKTFPYGD